MVRSSPWPSTSILPPSTPFSSWTGLTRGDSTPCRPVLYSLSACQLGISPRRSTANRSGPAFAIGQDLPTVSPDPIGGKLEEANPVEINADRRKNFVHLLGFDLGILHEKVNDSPVCNWCMYIGVDPGDRAELTGPVRFMVLVSEVAS